MSRTLGTSVSQKTNHESSEWLRKLHPYFPEDNAANFSEKVDPYEVERAFGNRAIPKLVDLLNFEDLPEDSRITTLNILTGLTRNQREKQQALACNAVSACTRLARESSDTEVRSGAFNVLASLAVLPQALKAFESSSSIDVMTAGIQAEQDAIREAAALALLNISGSRPGVDLLVAAGQNPELETVREMVRVLIGPSPVVSLYLVAALGNICRYDSGIELALSPGIVPKLVELLKNTSSSDSEIPTGSDLKGPNPEGLRMQTVSTIWNVANHMDGKSELIDRDVVPALAAVISDPSVEVRRCCAGALMSLAINEMGKIEAADHCAEGLTQLLLDDDDRVRRNAEAALVYCSENRDARLRLVKQMVGEWTGSAERATELVTRVYGGSASEPLAQLLRQDDPDFALEVSRWERTAITTCLMKLCVDGQDDAVMSTLYIVESLASQLAGPAKQQAARALQILCQNHSYAKKRLRNWSVSADDFFARDGDILSDLAQLC